MQDYPTCRLSTVTTHSKLQEFLHSAGAEIEQTEINFALAYTLSISYIINMKKTTKELNNGQE
jgi:hypothetical protein